MTETNQRSGISLWMQAVRPFSFTASITPIILGTSLAFFEGTSVNFIYFFAALFGGILLHAGTNLVSEYYDLKIGADTKKTFGSSKILVDELMSPARVLRGGILCFVLATLIGVYLFSQFGVVIVYLGLAGIFGGFFYTANPVGYKYRALGEPLVFTLMGPLMVLGAYFVQTRTVAWTPVWVSIPIAILVAAILSANNLRDIQDDVNAGFNTLASKMGWASFAKFYKMMLISAYVVMIALVGLKIAPIWALITLLSIPPVLKLFKTVGEASPSTPSDLAIIDISTAQFHFLFGLLLTISFVLGKFF